MKEQNGASIVLKILRYIGLALLIVLAFPVLLIMQLLKVSD